MQNGRCSTITDTDEQIAFLDIESAGLEFTRPIIQIAAVAVDSQLCELESIELKIAFVDADADPVSLSKNKYDPQVCRRDAIEKSRS